MISSGNVILQQASKLIRFNQFYYKKCTNTSLLSSFHSIASSSSDRSRNKNSYYDCIHTIHDPTNVNFNGISNSHIFTTKRNLNFVAHKAPVSLTPSSRSFFKNLIAKKIELSTAAAFDTEKKKTEATDTTIVGIMLKYQQSLTGQPRMVFTFEFVASNDLHGDDEGVSLEIESDGITPRSPVESKTDGLPKLYIHHHGFMKVLGSTIDIMKDGVTPFLLDREGNIMDPNNT